MQNKYSHIQWVVQQNLTNLGDLNSLQSACEKLGVKYVPVNVIPFTSTLPAFSIERKSIFYSSTTFNSLVAADVSLREGLFYDENSFSMNNYFARWGKFMLNDRASVLTFDKLMLQDHDVDKLFFIRPDDDTKSFSGEVKKFSEIKEWYEKLKMFDNTNLSLDSKIVVAEPYNIQYEWRLRIVNKKVIAASKYKENFRLVKNKGCTQEVVSFAEERCLTYTPHPVFVMDICLCGDQLYIVECGCMNSAGFYKADIEKIVLEVSDYFANAVA